MSSIGGPNIIRDGLVLYLDAGNIKSYPGSGTNWFDLSNKGNNGTLINGPTFDSNNFGSIDFDGVDDRVDIPNNQQLSDDIFSNSLFSTLECWVNIREFKNWTCMINKAFGGSYSNTTGPGLWSNINGYQFVIGTGVGGNPTGGSKRIDFTANINQWYYIVGTVNGNVARMYVNGSLHGTNTSTVNTIEQNTSPIVIGARCTTCTPYLDGNIGFIKIYNKELTPEEILQNYNATKSRFGL
jgi:hypothetical protein